MPHIPGHRGNNAFAGFENLRQRMQGLTPPGPSPIPYRMRGLPGRQATPEEIRIPQDPIEGMLPPRSFIPPSRPLPMTPVPLPPPFPMPERPRGFQPPPWMNEGTPLLPPVPMPEYRPPGRGPLNPLPLPVPMPGPGWPGPGGFRPQDLRPPLLRFPGVRDLLYRWPAPGTPPIGPETLPYYPSSPPPRRVLY